MASTPSPSPLSLQIATILFGEIWNQEISVTQHVFKEKHWILNIYQTKSREYAYLTSLSGVGGLQPRVICAVQCSPICALQGIIKIFFIQISNLDVMHYCSSSVSSSEKCSAFQSKHAERKCRLAMQIISMHWRRIIKRLWSRRSSSLELLLAAIIKAGRTSANSDRSIQHRTLFSYASSSRPNFCE